MVCLTMFVLTQWLPHSGLYGKYYADANTKILLVFLLWVFLFVAVLIAFVVFLYITLYQIYKKYSPDEAVLYLLLSIFVGLVLSAVFLFVIRDRVGRSIAYPPGVWENGVFRPYYINPANPYGGYQPGYPPFGYDPYGWPQPPYAGTPPYGGPSYSGYQPPSPGQGETSGQRHSEGEE